MSRNKRPKIYCQRKTALTMRKMKNATINGFTIDELCRAADMLSARKQGWIDGKDEY